MNYLVLEILNMKLIQKIGVVYLSFQLSSQSGFVIQRLILLEKLLVKENFLRELAQIKHGKELLLVLSSQ